MIEHIRQSLRQQGRLIALLTLAGALSQAGSLYVVIVAILAVQAVFEILYVRKVLLMGGTGVPLAPW
jgi:hypothetical protein